VGMTPSQNSRRNSRPNSNKKTTPSKGNISIINFMFPYRS
jgi:hypothetical protein